MVEPNAIKASVHREAVIDSLKGFAILLVVIGHSIQKATNNDFTTLSFRFIYSFHMPLFMFLSGYVTVYSPTNSGPRLKKRFFRLVTPFLSWAIVSFVIYCLNHHSIEFQYWIELAKNVDNGLWFLWALFLIHVVFYLNEKISKSFAGYSLFIIAILLQLVPVGSVLGVGFVKLYLIFFVLGYYANHEAVHSFICSKNQILFCFFSVLFLLLFQYWTFSNDLNFIREDFNITNNKLFRITGMLYRFAVPFCGIMAIYTLFHSYIFLKDKLEWLGKNTIEIYTSHAYFISLVLFLCSYAHITNIFIQILVSAIVGLILSLSLAYFVKKSETMSFLLYGTKNNY